MHNDGSDYASISVQQSPIGRLSMILKLQTNSQLFGCILLNLMRCKRVFGWLYDISLKPTVNYQISRKHWFFGNVIVGRGIGLSHRWWNVSAKHWDDTVDVHPLEGITLSLCDWSTLPSHYRQTHSSNLKDIFNENPPTNISEVNRHFYESEIFSNTERYGSTTKKSIISLMFGTIMGNCVESWQNIAYDRTALWSNTLILAKHT